MIMNEYIIENKKVEVDSSFRHMHVKIDGQAYDVYAEPLMDDTKRQNLRYGLQIDITGLNNKHPDINEKTIHLITEAIKKFQNDSGDGKGKYFLEIS